MLTKGEISNLRGLLDKLSVNVDSRVGQSKTARRKRRRKNRNMDTAVTSNIPAAFIAPTFSSGGRRRRRRRRGGIGGIGIGSVDGGTIVLKRKEFFTELTISSSGTYLGVVDFYPDDSEMPFLAGMFKMYEKIVFHRIVLHYVPAVGTTKDGLIIFGVDGSGDKKAPTKRGDVAALQPCSDGPIWQGRTLALNQKQLMTRAVYSVHNFGTEGENPGSVKVYASGPKSTVIGELWIEYHVTLSAPRNAQEIPRELFSTIEILDDVAVARAFWTSDNTFSWTKTKEQMNYFSFRNAETFNQSTVTRGDGLLVRPGDYSFGEMQVNSNNITSNITLNCYGSPLVVEDPDKGVGYRWLLPTCTFDFEYRGFTGDSLFDMRINCDADVRWKNIFDFSNDPTVYSVSITAVQGCELVGNVVSNLFGPQPGISRFNRFCVLVKQILKVYSLPAILKFQFTFQVAASQYALKRYVDYPIIMDAHLNWRGYLNSFLQSNSRDFEASSLDVAGSYDVDDEYEFIAVDNA